MKLKRMHADGFVLWASELEPCECPSPYYCVTLMIEDRLVAGLFAEALTAAALERHDRFMDVMTDAAIDSGKRWTSGMWCPTCMNGVYTADHEFDEEEVDRMRKLFEEKRDELGHERLV